MKVLIANQAFYPDVASSGQHAADLAIALAEAGHDVNVISAQSAYDQPEIRFAAHETWRGVNIRRIACLRLARNTAWKRAATFASFLMHCAIRMWSAPRPDLIITLTSPPLLCVLGALLAKLRGARLVLWIMDLNPDEAVAAGWLRSGSLTERFLRALLRFSLRASDRIVVLDRFMRERVIAHGASPDKISVVPPWPHSNDVVYDPAGRDAFREQQGWQGKFVVMYSGNHSPCHSLDALLAAARQLADRTDIAFAFVGGGSEFRKVGRFASEHGLNNIACLGYQPREQLCASLSAADLHAVVMGDPFVGIVHPCKIYNILTLGIPVLYVGPTPSPITELVARATSNHHLISARHNQADSLAAQILRAAGEDWTRQPVQVDFAGEFSQDVLIARFLNVLDSLGRSTARPSRLPATTARSEQV